MSDAQRMRTKKEALEAVINEFNLDVSDPFTRMLATAFAMQDMLEDTRTALTRSEAKLHLQMEKGQAPQPEARAWTDGDFLDQALTNATGSILSQYAADKIRERARELRQSHRPQEDR